MWRLAGIGLAVHCLIAYGVQLTSPRVAIHSIADCFFYGAFAKMLLVHSRRPPAWALPVASGTLAIVIGVLWYTWALMIPRATVHARAVPEPPAVAVLTGPLFSVHGLLAGSGVWIRRAGWMSWSADR